MLTPLDSEWDRLLVQFIGTAVTRAPRCFMEQARLQSMFAFMVGQIMWAMWVCMSTIGLSETCGCADLVGRTLHRFMFMWYTLRRALGQRTAVGAPL